jgi:hypothetical protein
LFVSASAGGGKPPGKGEKLTWDHDCEFQPTIAEDAAGDGKGKDGRRPSRKVTVWPENLAITTPQDRHPKSAARVSKVSVATRTSPKP